MYRPLKRPLMAFCRECGKEINNEWTTCPFCSANLQYGTPHQPNNYNKNSHGTPTTDWEKVTHNGQLIELFPSDDWQYYWADDEWHWLNYHEQSTSETEENHQDGHKVSTPPAMVPTVKPYFSIPSRLPLNTMGAPSYPPLGPPQLNTNINKKIDEITKKAIIRRKLPLFWKICIVIVVICSFVLYTDKWIEYGVGLVGWSICGLMGVTLSIPFYILIKSLQEGEPEYYDLKPLSRKKINNYERRYKKEFKLFDEGYNQKEVAELTFDGAGALLTILGFIPVVGIIAKLGSTINPSERLREINKIYDIYCRCRDD